MKTFERIRKTGWREIFKVNKLLKILVLSDILLISSFGFISPIFAVFVNDNIIGGSLIVVGIAEAIFLGVKSLLQIPIGILIDNTEGEKIDVVLVIVGSLMSTIAIFMYIFATLPIHIYFIQFIVAIGASLSYPSWMGLFTRNMEVGKESLVWSLHSTSVELASAVTAFFGGIIADKLGFNSLFFIVFIISLIGTITLFVVYPRLDKK